MKLFISGIAVLVMATFLVTTAPHLVKAQSCSNSATASIIGSNSAVLLAGTNNCNAIAAVGGLNQASGSTSVSASGNIPPPSVATGVAGGPNSASANSGTSSASASAH